MKKIAVVTLVLALSTMMVGAASTIVTCEPGQSAMSTQGTNDRLAAAWPTMAYMTWEPP